MNTSKTDLSPNYDKYRRGLGETVVSAVAPSLHQLVTHHIFHAVAIIGLVIAGGIACRLVGADSASLAQVIAATFVAAMLIGVSVIALVLGRQNYAKVPENQANPPPEPRDERGSSPID